MQEQAVDSLAMPEAPCQAQGWSSEVAWRHTIFAAASPVGCVPAAIPPPVCDAIAVLELFSSPLDCIRDAPCTYGTDSETVLALFHCHPSL